MGQMRTGGSDSDVALVVTSQSGDYVVFDSLDRRHRSGALAIAFRQICHREIAFRERLDMFLLLSQKGLFLPVVLNLLVIGEETYLLDVTSSRLRKSLERILIAMSAAPWHDAWRLRCGRRTTAPPPRILWSPVGARRFGGAAAYACSPPALTSCRTVRNSPRTLPSLWAKGK